VFFSLILGVQILVAASGGVTPLAHWFEIFGLSRSGFFEGRIWQPLSYGILHGNWLHAGLNAAFILLIGSRIEFIAGRPAMLKVTLAGALAGGLAHLLLGSGLLVGMSGACMALLILLTTLSPESRMFPLPVSGKSLGLGLLMAALLLALIDPALGIPVASSAGKALTNNGMGSWFQLGHACHFGGGLAGWLCGRWLLRPRVSLQHLRRDRARREAG
jgi:membrane associated rhomboid family serine protease